MMMKRRLIYVFGAIVVAGLLGCKEVTNLSDVNAPNPSSTTLQVTNISGTQTDMTGSWRSMCYKPDNLGGVVLVGLPAVHDWQDLITISQGRFTEEIFEFPSTDFSCTGSSTLKGVSAGTLTRQGDEAIVGWVDLSNAVALPPMARDNSGPIATTATYTKVDANITSATGVATSVVSVGQTVDVSLVVDATGAKPIAYNINYGVGFSTGIVDDFFIKQ